MNWWPEPEAHLSQAQLESGREYISLAYLHIVFPAKTFCTLVFTAKTHCCANSAASLPMVLEAKRHKKASLPLHIPSHTPHTSQWAPWLKLFTKDDRYSRHDLGNTLWEFDKYSLQTSIKRPLHILSHTPQILQEFSMRHWSFYTPPSPPPPPPIGRIVVAVIISSLWNSLHVSFCTIFSKAPKNIAVLVDHKWQYFHCVSLVHSKKHQ